MSATLIVIAKAPVPGAAKTRLCPPCTPEQAAALAEAALRDTLEAVLAADASRRVLVLDGDVGPWLPEGFEVIPQRGVGLEERLAAAFDDVGEPALLVGMDTPQVTARQLDDAWSALMRDDADAVLGEASDGGWWAIGLLQPDPRVFEGVPMSRADTVIHQRKRLTEVGLRVTELPVMRDFDVFEDAIAVAEAAPSSRFASVLASVLEGSEAAPTRVPASSGLPQVIAVAAWVVLIVVAWLWGSHLNATNQHDMLVQAPPLTAHFVWTLGPWIIPALVFAGAAVWFGPRLAADIDWRWLLLLSAVAAAAWAILLAASDHPGRITYALTSEVDYYADLARVVSPGEFLKTFLDNVPSFATHSRAHPPGMLLILWSLERIGLGGLWPAALLEISVGALAVPAVLVAAREMAGESRARAAAPFLVLAPAALWVATSGDALFMGVSAWAVALFALATRDRGARSDLTAIGSGFLFGMGLFLSYGLALMAIFPVAIALHRRRLRPLLLAGIGPLVFLALFTAVGFWWFDGLASTRVEYAESIARYRPYSYFVFANIAAFAIVVGPATAAGLVRLRDRALWVLVGSGLVAVAVADLSGMSKAEVERIWLPFALWVILATASLAGSRRIRVWLGVQVALAFAIQLSMKGIS